MKYIYFLIIFIFSVPAHASVVEVKSGEHDGFSRLVFLHSIGESPVFQKNKNFIRVRFGSPMKFNLERIFDYIPRERILDVSGDLDSVLVTMACECEVEFVKFTESISYLDVWGGELINEIEGKSLDLARSPYIPHGNTENFPVVFDDWSDFPLVGRGGFSSGIFLTGGFNGQDFNEHVTRVNKLFLGLQSVKSFHGLSGGIIGVESEYIDSVSSMVGEVQCLEPVYFHRIPVILNDRPPVIDDLFHLRSNVVNHEFGLDDNNLAKYVLRLFLFGFFSESRQYIDMIYDENIRRELMLVANLLEEDSPRQESEESIFCGEVGRFWSFLAGDGQHWNDEVLRNWMLYAIEFPAEIRGMLLSKFLSRLSNRQFESFQSIVTAISDLEEENVNSSAVDLLFSSALKESEDRLSRLNDSGDGMIYSGDRFFLESFLQTDVSDEGDRVLREMFTNHTNNRNWLASLKILEMVKERGNDALLDQLLNEFFVPALFEQGEFFTVFQVYHLNEFSQFVSALSSKNAEAIDKAINVYLSFEQESYLPSDNSYLLSDGEVENPYEEGRFSQVRSLLRESEAVRSNLAEVINID